MADDGERGRTRPNEAEQQRTRPKQAEQNGTNLDLDRHTLPSPTDMQELPGDLACCLVRRMPTINSDMGPAFLEGVGYI